MLPYIFAVLIKLEKMGEMCLNISHSKILIERVKSNVLEINNKIDLTLDICLSLLVIKIFAVIDKDIPIRIIIKSKEIKLFNIPSSSDVIIDDKIIAEIYEKYGKILFNFSDALNLEEVIKRLKSALKARINAEMVGIPPYELIAPKHKENVNPM